MNGVRRKGEAVRTTMLRLMTLAAVFVLAAFAAGCGGSDEGTVNATLKDFAITVDPTTAPAGDVTFDITNDGPSQHEFVVFKTDLAPDQLPMTEDENGVPIVDEEGEGVEHVDEVEDINSGSSDTLAVSLTAGNYVLICNLPSHYQQGMHTALTVSG
jgi:uncharacterized cupredoxin-like copper-binding protein